MQPKSTLSRLALAAAAGMLLMAPASPATAETFVTDVRLEDGGSQRVLGAAPARTATASFYGTWPFLFTMAVVLGSEYRPSR